MSRFPEIGQICDSGRENRSRKSTARKTIALCRLHPASFLALSFEERAKEDREAKKVGNPPHTSLNDHKRLRCSARSFRALDVRRLLRPTFSHRGSMQACGLPRNTKIQDRAIPQNRLILAHVGIRPFFANRRPARPHCEKRGERGGAGASARSGCAKSAVFCARSASGDDTRGFSPCLTFWYFWVKPKVRRKTVADFLSAQRLGSCSASFVPQVFLALSFEERAKEDREAKMIGKRTASR